MNDKTIPHSKELYIYICIMVCVFANGAGDWSSIPVWVVPKTQKIVLDTSLHNPQYYKVLIKGK